MMALMLGNAAQASAPAAASQQSVP